jgi:DNA polymerase
MKEWLSENGLETDSLDKKAVAELLKTAPPKLAKVLEFRQQLAKSSVKKYQAMQNAVCKDGRARGMFQFYGANRSGRFSGRLVQLQNLPQNHISDLEDARNIVKSGDFESMNMLYDNIPNILSELIRTAFVPQNGYKFIVADFSAIEARVIAWLAGEKWRDEVFRNGGDIYCASASQMFGIPVEKNGINGHLRQKGKIAELALGYGGSVGAFKAMGALDMGLTEDELKPLVDSWRSANPNIVRLWWDIDDAVKRVVTERTSAQVKGIKIFYKSGILFITLPSKRTLTYVKPRMGLNQFGGESVTYEGIGAAKKWERIESYGPKFVENIVQAIARDILLYAMKTLRNCSIVAHVHDELIIEADMRMSLGSVCEQMGRTPPWADGLLLRADGYECKFYKKE